MCLPDITHPYIRAADPCVYVYLVWPIPASELQVHVCLSTWYDPSLHQRCRSLCVCLPGMSSPCIRVAGPCVYVYLVWPIPASELQVGVCLPDMTCFCIRTAGPCVSTWYDLFLHQNCRSLCVYLIWPIPASELQIPVCMSTSYMSSLHQSFRFLYLNFSLVATPAKFYCSSLCLL